MTASLSAFAEGKAIPAPFTRGVNFSNWMEFRTPADVDRNMFTRKDFENIKKLGCDVVRVPIHFELLCGPKPKYTINKKIFAIMDDLATWAEEFQIYVIFDFHNNTAGGTKTQDGIEKILLAIWGQVSERYSSSTKYICYEIMNEPHGIANSKWAKVLGNVIKCIREHDAEHYIIAGGADWNSFAALKELPDYGDPKLIYTFHFYEPMLFTHQGAEWNDIKRLKGIPFPYDKARMPKLPKSPTDSEKWYFSKDYNYAEKGTPEAVAQFFDQYVEFSQKRNVPVYCGEFGVYNKYAAHEDRIAWYEITARLLDEKGISHTSWDYYGGFGLFKNGSKNRFPEDLDMDLLKALGLNTEGL